MKARNVKTAELSGAALDYMTAVAVGMECQIVGNSFDTSWLEDRPDGSRSRVFGRYRPSIDWSQGGPLIESNGIWLSDDNETEENWIASSGGVDIYCGKTPLIAACRAIVATKLGDTVDVPEVLL